MTQIKRSKSRSRSRSKAERKGRREGAKNAKERNNILQKPVIARSNSDVAISLCCRIPKQIKIKSIYFVEFVKAKIKSKTPNNE